MNSNHVWDGRKFRRLITISLALLFLLFVVWGNAARIEGAILAPGVVQVKNERQIVQHPDGGIVNEIFAFNGDAVQADDILLRLDSKDLVAEKIILERKISALLAKSSRLVAERDMQSVLTLSEENNALSGFEEAFKVQSNLFDIRAGNLQKELEKTTELITQTKLQSEGVEQQLDATKRRIKLLVEEYEASLELSKKGLSIRSQLLSQKRAVAELEGQKGKLIAERAQLLSEVASYEIEKSRLPTHWQEQAINELAAIKVELSELQEKHQSVLEKLRRLDIRSPATGLVFSSEVNTLNSVISSAQPIMFIVPQNLELIVSAKVTATDIDQVRVEQPVSLRFSALDSKFTPNLAGLVQNISADALIDEATGVSYFTVESRILHGELEKLKNQELLPGLPVESYILTGERSPMSYLTKPVMDYFYRAFRGE